MLLTTQYFRTLTTLLTNQFFAIGNNSLSGVAFLFYRVIAYCMHNAINTHGAKALEQVGERS